MEAKRTNPNQGPQKTGSSFLNKMSNKIFGREVKANGDSEAKKKEDYEAKVKANLTSSPLSPKELSVLGLAKENIKATLNALPPTDQVKANAVVNGLLKTIGQKTGEIDQAIKQSKKQLKEVANESNEATAGDPWAELDALLDELAVLNKHGIETGKPKPILKKTHSDSSIGRTPTRGEIASGASETADKAEKAAPKPEDK